MFGLMVWFILVEKDCSMGAGGGGGDPWSQEAERDECWCPTGFFTFIQSGTLGHGMVLPTSGWVLPPQSTFSGNTHTDSPEVSFHGGFESLQVDKEEFDLGAAPTLQLSARGRRGSDLGLCIWGCRRAVLRQRKINRVRLKRNWRQEPSRSFQVWGADSPRTMKSKAWDRRMDFCGVPGSAVGRQFPEVSAKWVEQGSGYPALLTPPRLLHFPGLLLHFSL